MNEGEVISLIRSELKKSLTIIFAGVTADNTKTHEGVDQLYGSQGKNESIPQIRPYGYASRAPAGTIAVVAKTSYDPRSKILLGHRDISPPAMEQGETVVYDAYGHQIRLEQSAMRFGSATSANPMVLGTETMAFFRAVINAFLDAPQVCITPLGSGVLDPSIRVALTQAVTTYITTTSTNIVSAIAFTERGES